MIDTFCHLTEYFYCYKLLQQFFVSLGPSADSIVPNVHLAKAVMPQYYAIVTILLFMGHRSGDQALGNISSFYLDITIYYNSAFWIWRSYKNISAIVTFLSPQNCLTILKPDILMDLM